MKVLVTFAVDAEFAPWRKLRKFNKVDSESMECFSTLVDGAEIVVLLTGIGGKKAGVEATKVIWDSNIDYCVSSGLAGGLRQEHLAGEIVAAMNVRNEKSQEIGCDARLLQQAVECGAKKVDSFISVDEVVVRAAEKKQLGALADVVEMESYEVLTEAAAWGGKVIAVRGISDTATEDLPLDFNRVTTDEGSVSMMKVFGQIAQHPGSIPSLVKFGRQSRIAAEKLAEFLEKYIPHVVENEKQWFAAGAKVG